MVDSGLVSTYTIASPEEDGLGLLGDTQPHSCSQNA